MGEPEVKVLAGTFGGDPYVALSLHNAEDMFLDYQGLQVVSLSIRAAEQLRIGLSIAIETAIQIAKIINEQESNS